MADTEPRRLRVWRTLAWFSLLLVAGAAVAISATARVSVFRDYSYALSQGWDKTPLLAFILTLGISAAFIGFILLAARTTSRRERIVLSVGIAVAGIMMLVALGQAFLWLVFGNWG